MRILIVVLGLALTACGERAPESAGVQPLAAANAAVSTPEFVQLVANINKFQVEAAAIARERARRDDVKAFAGAIAIAHEAKQNELFTAADRIGIEAIPHLNPDQQERLNALRAASDEGFDALYLDQQIEAHERWGHLIEDYLKDAPDTPVRTWAENTNELFRSRLTRAHALEAAG